MDCWNDNTVEAYSSAEDSSRLNTLHPAIVRKLPDIANKTVLDFGCGVGNLTSRIIKKNPQKVDCIDCSETMIKKAKKNLGHINRGKLNFIVDDHNLLPTENKYDIIICSLVLMMQNSIDIVNEITSGIASSLKSNGHAIFAVTHPCFRENTHTDFVNKTPENFFYCKSGLSYEVNIFDNNGSIRTSFNDFHWTLSDYMNLINTNDDIILSTLEEVRCGDNQKVPDYLIYIIEKRR